MHLRAVIGRRQTMDQSFFGQLKSLASYLDDEVEDIKTSFETPPIEFNGPEVCMALLDVKKTSNSVQDCLSTEVGKIRSGSNEIDHILILANTLLEKQESEISNAENFMKQYGFKPQEIPEDIATEEIATVLPTSVQSTPVNFAKPNLRKNRTPQLEDAGLSEMTLKRILAMDKKPPVARELIEQQNVTDAQVQKEAGQHTATVNTANKLPQLEDAGISKAMMQRLEAIEKQQQQPRVPSKGKVNPFEPGAVPPSFQHDGIICTPSLFGSKPMDRSVLDLHEALASPMHPGSSVHKFDRGFKDFDVNRERTFQPSALNTTYTSKPLTLSMTYNKDMKENVSPKEPKLFSQGIDLGDKDTEKNATDVHKKLVFDDIPKSPKLLGTYNEKITTDAHNKLVFDDMPQSPKLLGTYNFSFK